MPIKTRTSLALLFGGSLPQLPCDMLSGCSDYEAGMSPDLQDVTSKR